MALNSLIDNRWCAALTCVPLFVGGFGATRDTELTRVVVEPPAIWAVARPSSSQSTPEQIVVAAQSWNVFIESIQGHFRDLTPDEKRNVKEFYASRATKRKRVIF